MIYDHRNIVHTEMEKRAIIVEVVVKNSLISSTELSNHTLLPKKPLHLAELPTRDIYLQLHIKSSAGSRGR